MSDIAGSEQKPRTGGFAKAVRLACALCAIGSFATAAALAWPLDRRLVATLFICGIAVHIVAVFALLSMHRVGARPSWEPVAFLLAPAVAWWILGGPEGRAAYPFWIFHGAFLFVALTGGFLLGVFLSPVIAIRQGLDGVTAARGVQGGIANVRRMSGLGTFGAVLFGATAIGLVALAVRASNVCGLARLPVASQIALALLATVATGAVAVLAYRNTIFGLMARVTAGRPR